MTMVMVMFTTQVVVSLSRVKNFHLDKVENECNASNSKHLGTHDHWWNKESLCSLDKEPDSHNPDCGHGDHGTDDFGTSPTVCQVIRRTSLSKTKSNYGDAEAYNI